MISTTIVKNAEIEDYQMTRKGWRCPFFWGGKFPCPAIGFVSKSSAWGRARSLISLSVFLAPLPQKTQFSILACKLIAVSAWFPEAVEVAFFQLLSVNYTGNDLYKAGITKRGSVIVRPPRNEGVFFPLFATFDAFYAYFASAVPHINLRLLHLVLRDY